MHASPFLHKTRRGAQISSARQTGLSALRAERDGTGSACAKADDPAALRAGAGAWIRYNREYFSASSLAT